MVCPALCHHIFLACKPAADFVCFSEICLVFRRTFINVLREHPEICKDNTCPGEQGEDVIVKPSCKHHGDKSCDNCKFSERVDSVSSVHESHEFFFQINHLPNNHYDARIRRESQ